MDQIGNEVTVSVSGNAKRFFLNELNVNDMWVQQVGVTR